ncbi:MAG: ABC transporter ATP-binding protein [Candidatus Pacebacteria bacterium]|nr:ABC transporter ATP-binding protein [Candidatus Paceibacterota bacterium]
MSSNVKLKSVTCAFSGHGKTKGETTLALDNVNLEIKAGEFFTLLGPSGSGKSTCLRVIGGFISPNSGEVSIHNRVVTHLPPNRREVNTVFQDYGLFPHFTVLENVGYGLMVRGVKRAERESRGREMLKLVRLHGLDDRKPGQLSGGQQQRVALARALMVEPKVLLLDEPLGALDLKLREEVQVELKAIQRQLGVTFVFVTHDQNEAMSLSDRIGVFNKGRIEQIASASELYNRPATRFVAEFIGSVNIFELNDGRARMVRPELIHIGGKKDAKLQAMVRDLHYFGSVSRLLVEPLAGELKPSSDLVTIEIRSSEQVKLPAHGESVYLHWDDAKTHVIAAEKGRR